VYCIVQMIWCLLATNWAIRPMCVYSCYFRKNVTVLRYSKKYTRGTGCYFWIFVKRERILMLLFFLWRCDPTRVMTFSFLKILDHIQRRTTVGRTSLEEWSAHRRDLYLTTQHSHQKNIHALGGIRPRDLSRRAAADPHPRPRGHWDWH
jgi:hypothetical protein